MPSDYGGIIYIPLDPAGAWKTELRHRLRGAGVTFDLNKAGL